MYDPLHTLKETANGNPSRGLSHTIQSIKVKDNEGEIKTSVSLVLTKPNIQYCVIQFAVFVGGTERNARLCQRNKEKKMGERVP